MEEEKIVQFPLNKPKNHRVVVTEIPLPEYLKKRNLMGVKATPRSKPHLVKPEEPDPAA